jgi:plastocyanin
VKGFVARLLILCAFAVAASPGYGAQSTLDLHGTARADAKPVVNAVIWLEAPNAPPATDHHKVVLDQRDLDFRPHVLAVRVGTKVTFPNNDRVFHNVFSFRDGRVFDLGMYPVGASKDVTFDRPGLSRIFCNIHPNMAAYVLSVDTPYFAVSDKSGAFTITGVPSSTYRYHGWRPGADQQPSGTWASTSGGPLTVAWP